MVWIDPNTRKRQNMSYCTVQLAMATKSLAMASWTTSSIAMATSLVAMASLDRQLLEKLHFHAKTIRVKYLVVNSPNCYNIIIWCPSFNLLFVFHSIKYLIMKYPLEKGSVGTIRGDQKIAMECYHNNLRL
jgi:hypothetical protein